MTKEFKPWVNLFEKTVILQNVLSILNVLKNLDLEYDI